MQYQDHEEKTRGGKTNDTKTIQFLAETKNGRSVNGHSLIENKWCRRKKTNPHGCKIRGILSAIY